MRAQGQNTITGDFSDYKFPQLVRVIESQTSYHIYYDSTETDSLEINVHPKQMSLQHLFDLIFKGTDIFYAFGTENEVFVSKRFSIQTTLPKYYFDPAKGIADSLSQAAFNADDAIYAKSNLKISAGE